MNGWHVNLLTAVGLTALITALPTRIANGQATDTPTSTPTRTPTPTFTPSPDRYETNDTSATAKLLSVGAVNSGLSLYPSGDLDWFTFDVKTGKRYQINIDVEAGLDSFLELYSTPAGSALASNDDKATGDLGSRIGYTFGTAGTYYLKITNLDRTDPAHKSYTLTISEIAVEPTATMIPGSADQHEPNWDFSRATLIGSGDMISANFVPWTGSDLNAPDNDFYRIWVKAGVTVTCETSNLGPSTDTNVIFYDATFQTLGGNDDVAFGDFASRVSAVAPSSGYLYVLVGQGHPLPPSETPNLTYNLVCILGVPTSTPSPEVELPVPASGFAVQSSEPKATPTATQTFIGVLPVATPARPTPPVPAVATFKTLIFVDQDGDHAVDPGEGVHGMVVEVHDLARDLLLARGITNASGEAYVTGNGFGLFEIRVPYLGLRRTLRPTDTTVAVEIRAVPMPGRIP